MTSPQAVATAQALRAFREGLRLTQNQLAESLGMTSRAYQELEAGRSQVRVIHALALETISLRMAVAHGEPSLAAPTIREEARKLALILDPVGRDPRTPP